MRKKTQHKQVSSLYCFWGFCFNVLEQSFTHMKWILLFIPLAESFWAYCPLHNLKANLFSFIVIVKDAHGQFLLDLLYCSWDTCRFEIIFFHPDCLVHYLALLHQVITSIRVVWFSITVARLCHWPEEPHWNSMLSFSGKAQNLLLYQRGNSVYRQ